jgi:hypothetical protein
MFIPANWRFPTRCRRSVFSKADAQQTKFPRRFASRSTTVSKPVTLDY